MKSFGLLTGSGPGSKILTAEVITSLYRVVLLVYLFVFAELSAASMCNGRQVRAGGMTTGVRLWTTHRATCLAQSPLAVAAVSNDWLETMTGTER